MELFDILLAKKKNKAEGDGSVQNPLEYASQLYQAFQSAVFPDGYELTVDIPNISNLYRAFYGTKGIEKLILKGNVNNNQLNCLGLFQNSNIVEVDFTEFYMLPTSIYNFCNGVSDLVSLNGIIDMSQCTSVTNAFPDSAKFKEVRFKENTINISISFAYCSGLSSDSVQSIINGLETVTTAQTLTLNKAIVLTDEQKATIQGKGWTLVQ